MLSLVMERSAMRNRAYLCASSPKVISCTFNFLKTELVLQSKKITYLDNDYLNNYYHNELN